MGLGSTIATIGGIGVALFAFDRLMLVAEARGWIYWRRRKPSPGTAGNALLKLHAMIEPSKKHLVDVRKDEAGEDEDQSDPPGEDS
ncbi:hypothetical protein K8I61_04450 [bacterium]|nr:hypothetical protein [bacterium]